MISPQSLHELKEAAEAAETDFDRVQISVGGGMRATKTVPAYIALANPATIKALIADYERMRGDAEMFAALRDNSWDLRCFNVPTGGDDYDIGWRVIGHWMAEPQERVLAEVFSGDPAEAVRQALTQGESS